MSTGIGSKNGQGSIALKQERRGIEEGGPGMPLTRSFRVTVMERAERDPEFRRGLLLEAVNCLLEGEFAPAMIILRDYVNATVGFRKLAEETNHSPKSLMRMLSPTGNPRSDNLLEIIRCLQEHEGIRLEVAAVR